MTEFGVTETGQTFNPGSVAKPRLLKPKSPGEHVWMVGVTYVLSTEDIRRGMDGLEPVLMDTENIATFMVGCYVCEVQYEKRLTFRKCPGEPSPSIRDNRPHSRACGIAMHEHGPQCNPNCPTCGDGEC